MKKSAKKVTCYFCKYVIVNTQKCKYVTYRNIKKPICRYCKASNHKPLNKKYTNFDIECTSCKKPVKYNSSIACSICNHFVHAKCNYNLTAQDITNIENICDFFMCKKCNESVFPQYYKKPTREHNKQPKPPVQCFTCTKSISNHKYSNKNIIYNDIYTSLCITCSVLGTNLNVRDSSAIEFLDCSACKKNVKYESIFCNLCQHWVHPDCNGLSKKDLQVLGDDENDWHCLKCTLDIFPHFLINTDNETYNSDRNSFKTFDNCSMCNKTVTGNYTISCSDCRHWVHRKCIGQFDNNNDYQRFLSDYESKEWQCPKCLSEILPFILLDNLDFNIMLLENTITPIRMDKETYKNIFSTIKDLDLVIKSNDDENKYLNDIDPDANFNTIIPSEYIFETHKIPKSDLTLMTFNIRSIRKNFEKLVDLISQMSQKTHIITLTETWLADSDNPDDYNIEGYHLPLLQNRKNKHGGGVMTYIHKDIDKYKVNKSVTYSDEYNHCLATDITINNISTTILNVYRSPTPNNTNFIPIFEEKLKILNNRQCYILGDFNFNLININNHEPTEQYFDLLTRHCFKPLITKPTRITSSSQTLIDHIWTNQLSIDTKISSHILITDITDHLPCFSAISNNQMVTKGYRYIQKREITDKNKENFRKHMAEATHALSFHTNNIMNTLNRRYIDYFDHFKLIYDKHFPIKTMKIHNKTYSKPWITAETQKLIKKKNKLYSNKLKNNSRKKNKDKYRTIKKELEKKLKIDKREYFNNKLTKDHTTIKQKWDVIRTIINRKRSCQSPCQVPISTLGKHYSTNAENLSKKLKVILKEDIPSPSISRTQNDESLLMNNNQSDFNFKIIQERQVYETILKLDINKGPGIDEIDVKALKFIADIVSPHLATLFNQSLTEGIYPDSFKTAKCVPIYKGAPLDPDLPISYRPISILNAVNKVFERIIHDQLAIYFEKNTLLPTFQYGYRKNHNTTQAILDFNSYVTECLNNKLVTIAIFMDLSKAFDTVDKSILSDKLRELGISSSSIKLIDSYMSNRKLCFNNNKTEFNLQYGVPQGSILGPLLFLAYIYDMHNITPHNKVIVYADDTTVLISGRNLTETKQHCNDILERFYTYFSHNKLSINPDKTKYIIYKPKYLSQKNHKKLQDINNINLTMDNTIIKEVKSIRFLGVILTNKLNWELHKKHIKQKINKTLGILYKSRTAMNETGLIKMYKTFIEPYFLYALQVWGHSVKSDTDTINILQNKVIRIVYNCKRSDDAWNENHGRILNIQQLYQKVITRICYKHHANFLPKYFSKEIMPNVDYYNERRNRKTRSSIHNIFDYAKTNNPIKANNFKENCIKLWNEQSSETKTKPYQEHWNRIVNETYHTDDSINLVCLSLDDKHSY